MASISQEQCVPYILIEDKHFLNKIISAQAINEYQ